MSPIALETPLAPLELEVAISFQSEFHIGTGYGIPGVVNASTTRDAKGRLMIPGTTVKGVIRDACETVARLMQIPHCDGTYDQSHHLCGINFKPPVGEACSLCTLFGNRKHEAALRFNAARLPHEVERVLEDDRLPETVRDRLVHVQWHNRIDRELWRVDDNFLFAYELGLKTWSFTAAIREVAPIVPEHRRRHLVLLLAGIHFVRAIGGRRRTGKGACRLVPQMLMAQDESVDDLLDRIKELSS